MVLDTITLGLRGVQLLFAVIVLGTGAYVTDYLRRDRTDGLYFYFGFTPSQLAYVLFCAVWTLLVVGFQVGAPRINERLGHKFVILALDSLTMLFWFSGFIALAVFSGAFVGDNLPSWYRALQACIAFAAFTWVTFVVTVVLNTLSVFRGNTHNKHGGGGAPSSNFQQQV